MQYRSIGTSKIKISEIGFGCGNNAVLMVKASYDDQRKAVRHALDSGINFFDTAFAYGLGKSEENLGRILNDLGADPVISTRALPSPYFSMATAIRKPLTSRPTPQT
jgi:aryl-alcohol dehydrogenase-like predicted oxidoreductase